VSLNPSKSSKLGHHLSLCLRSLNLPLQSGVGEQGEPGEPGAGSEHEEPGAG